MKNFPLAIVVLSLLFAGCTPSADDAADMSIILGQRVGPITENTTHSQLVDIYGAGNVSDTDYSIGEGKTVPCTIIFPGTTREATVIWALDRKNEKVDRVVITGEKWLLPEGIRYGDDLDKVEEINGDPFMIYGFGWDYGGVGYFKGGKLDRQAQIWFGPSVSEGTDYNAVLGDSLFNSTDATMRAVDPRVVEVVILLGAPSED
jgi:hypothetical protein